MINKQTEQQRGNKGAITGIQVTDREADCVTPLIICHTGLENGGDKLLNHVNILPCPVGGSELEPLWCRSGRWAALGLCCGSRSVYWEVVGARWC